MSPRPTVYRTLRSCSGCSTISLSPEEAEFARTHGYLCQNGHWNGNTDRAGLRRAMAEAEGLEEFRRLQAIEDRNADDAYEAARDR